MMTSTSSTFKTNVGVWYDPKEDVYKSAVEDDTGTVMALVPKPTRREAEEQYKAALSNLDITIDGEVPFIGQDRPSGAPVIQVPAMQPTPQATTSQHASNGGTTAPASSTIVPSSTKPLDPIPAQSNSSPNVLQQKQPVSSNIPQTVIDGKLKQPGADKGIGDGLGGGQNQPINHARVEKAPMTTSGKPKPPSGPPPAVALKKPNDSTVATVDRPGLANSQLSAFQSVPGSNEQRTALQPQESKASVAASAAPAVANTKSVAATAASLPALSGAPSVSASQKQTLPAVSIPGKTRPQAPPFPPPVAQTQASSPVSTATSSSTSNSSQPNGNSSATARPNTGVSTAGTTGIASVKPAQSSHVFAQARPTAPDATVSTVADISEKLASSVANKGTPGSGAGLSSAQSTAAGHAKGSPASQSTSATSASSTTTPTTSSVPVAQKAVEKASAAKQDLAGATTSTSSLKEVSGSGTSSSSILPRVASKGDSAKASAPVTASSTVNKTASVIRASTLPESSVQGAKSTAAQATARTVANSAPPKPTVASLPSSLSEVPSPQSVTAPPAHATPRENPPSAKTSANSSASSASSPSASSLIMPQTANFDAPVVSATVHSATKTSPVLPSSTVPTTQGIVSSNRVSQATPVDADLLSIAAMSTSEAPPVSKCSCQLCSQTISERDAIWSHARECKRPRFCGVPYCEKLQEHDTSDKIEAFSVLQRMIHPPPVRSAASVVRRTGMLLPPAVDFSPIPADFAVPDKGFFGNEHILPASTVLMTGVYHPENHMLVGRWTTLALDQLKPGEPAYKPFTFEYSKEDVIDPASAKPCRICTDVRNGPESRYEFLMCDLCNQPFHLGCVGLTAVPVGDWLCNACTNTIKKLGERALPPTRNWKGRFQFFVDSKSTVWKKDSIDFIFDFSQARGNRLATIAGEGKNEFGTFTVKGVLLKSADAYVFQFSKTFVIRPRSPIPSA